MSRKVISTENISDAIDRFTIALKERIEEKGDHSFSSRHEILGVINEEVTELTVEVITGALSSIEEELLDIAVACVFGVACIKSNALDW